MLQSPQMESKWHDAPYCCIKGISLHLLLSWAHGSIHHHHLHPPFWRPSHLKSAVPRWQDKVSAPLPAMIWSSWGRRRSASSKWVGCSPLYCCYAAVMWRKITCGLGWWVGVGGCVARYPLCLYCVEQCCSIFLGLVYLCRPRIQPLVTSRIECVYAGCCA